MRLRFGLLAALLLAASVNAQEGQDVISNIETLPTPPPTPTPRAAVQQDVLVFYTQAAANVSGEQAILDKAMRYVDDTNRYYGLSGVNVLLNSVAYMPSPVQESGSGMTTTLTNFRQNTVVRSERAARGADMVLLISRDSDWCGYAYLWIQTANGVTTTDAYAVVNSNCDSRNFAHEVGHLQQLSHNIEDDNGPPGFVYGRGYRKCVSDGFRSIMSYKCPSVSTPQLDQFSSPLYVYNGYATGVANVTDAARALNDSAVMVANYLKAPVVQPPAPTPKPPQNVSVTD